MTPHLGGWSTEAHGKQGKRVAIVRLGRESYDE
jgi:hypothetical protein